MAHDRTLDHFGTEDTTTAVLEDDIGRYPAGMSLQEVLADIVARIENLELGCSTTTHFTANALVAWYVTANAVIKTTQTGGGSPFQVTADASIGTGTFTFSLSANAVLQAIASSGTQEFTADAVFIDDVVCE